MIPHARSGALTACLALPLVAAAVSLPGPAFPQYDSAAELTKACAANVAVAQRGIKTLEAQKPGRAWINAYDDLNARMEDMYGPVYLLSNVHPDKPIREAAEACELKWQDLLSSLGQNAKLYQAAKATKPQDATERQLLKTSLEAFEDSGVGLGPKQRSRAKAITDKITGITQQFERNIRDANVKVTFTDDELKGVPESVWKDAKQDAEGRRLLGLDYPTYNPVMQAAESEAARERMWRAKFTEGGPANLKLLDELVALRKEYAGLFGFKSYDDFVLQRRMVGSRDKAMRFLDDVKTAVTEREKRDVAELRDAKARHLGQSADKVALNRWDVGFYNERVVRERYAVDQEAFRKYFPPQESLQFTMRLIEQMMGVKYTRVNDAKLWHPEAQAYAVSDVATGKPLATLYVDLYPREGKYNHAAVWPIRASSTRLNRAPQAALVVNFDRKGLTLDELETLLHEFGHSVHADLSATRYSLQSGTSVVHDFVEAPSQMLEDWVYDKNVLKLFQEVCPSCTPVPDDILAKAVSVREFGKGAQIGRQHLYASYDLALYGPDAPPAMATWSKMEGATPLGYVPGSLFPAGFAHIAGGYAAGYYGYLYSLVVAMDLRTAFAANKLDPAVGLRYRSIVLANGGQKPARELVADFLGRETNSNAFFEYLKR
jgi:thimet oligopeptidase